MFDFKYNNQIIITENPDVSERLKLLIPNKRIETVTNYYHQTFDSFNIEKKLLSKDTLKVKLLTIASNYPHKNLDIIPEVIDYLLENYKGFKFEFILTLNKGDLKLSSIQSNHINFIGYTPIDDCPGLYSKSDFLFLPTLLECFSASYCEAMKMETPILTSDLNFAKGICKDAAVYFNPIDPKSIGDLIFKTHNNEILKNKIVKNGVARLKSFDSSHQRAVKYMGIINSI